MKSDIAQRIGALKRQAHRQSTAASSARERMREHLDRLAALRRGDLDPEEAAEVEALNAAVKRRFEEFGGEGAIVNG